jgi:starch phosphorylase
MELQQSHMILNQASRAPGEARVAYFSMEIALEPDIPTYSGGLGVLSGDTLRSASDLGVPMVAITLAHRKGYFRQVLDRFGNQSESPCVRNVSAYR